MASNAGALYAGATDIAYYYNFSLKKEEGEDPKIDVGYYESDPEEGLDVFVPLEFSFCNRVRCGTYLDFN